MLAVEAAAGVARAAAEFDEVLKTHSGSKCRAAIDRLRAPTSWPEAQRREASQAWEELQVAEQEERAGPSYMQDWVDRRNQQAVRAALALPDEDTAAAKRCWKLLSLVHGRAAQGEGLCVWDCVGVRVCGQVCAQLNALVRVCAGGGRVHGGRAVHA